MSATVRTVGALVRRHAVLAALLAAGTGLRCVVWLAYRPALLFPDSRSYLEDAVHLGLDKLRPSGYSFLLWPLIRTGGLPLVAAVQHVLGLAVAVALYAVLVRRGVPRIAAAVVTVPVLFDHLQLTLEQYVMSDVAFEALLVAGCVLLAWSDRPGRWAAAGAGLAFGLAAVTRSAGVGLAAVLVLALVAVRPGWRRSLATLVAFALPVVAYATVFDLHRGRFALSSYDGRYLYARLAPIADCRGLSLPPQERRLCPAEPLGHRLPTNVYMWDLARSPQYRVGHPSDPRALALVADWDRRVIRHQPLDYLRVAALDFAAGFRPFRTVGANDVAPTPWQFQPRYPDNSVDRPAALLADVGEAGPLRADPALAGFLTAYGRYAHVPGPVFAACLLAGLATGLAGVASTVRRGRRRGGREAAPARRPAWLFAVTCLAVLAVAALGSEFSWRYQLPQLALLPVAGVAAVAAWRGRRPGRPGTDASPAARPRAAGRHPRDRQPATPGRG